MTADNEEEDVEAFWGELERRPPIIRENSLHRDLDVAGKATESQILEYLRTLGNVVVDAELLSSICSRAVQIFMTNWQVTLREKNLAGLLEVVLEGQDLNAEDLKGFVRALPLSLIQKVVDSAVGSATGIHGLMAVEWHYRHKNLLDDYYLRITKEGRLYAKITQPKDEEIILWLDDNFEGHLTPILKNANAPQV